MKLVQTNCLKYLLFCILFGNEKNGMPLDEIKLLFCVHFARSIIKGNRHSHNGKQTIMMQDKRENEKSTLIASMLPSQAHSIWMEKKNCAYVFFSITSHSQHFVYQIGLVSEKEYIRGSGVWKFRSSGEQWQKQQQQHAQFKNDNHIHAQTFALHLVYNDTNYHHITLFNSKIQNTRIKWKATKNEQKANCLVWIFTVEIRMQLVESGKITQTKSNS